MWYILISSKNNCQCLCSICVQGHPWVALSACRDIRECVHTTPGLVLIVRALVRGGLSDWEAHLWERLNGSGSFPQAGELHRMKGQTQWGSQCRHSSSPLPGCHGLPTTMAWNLCVKGSPSSCGRCCQGFSYTHKKSWLIQHPTVWIQEKCRRLCRQLKWKKEGTRRQRVVQG